MRLAEVGDDIWARWRVDPQYQVGGGESLADMRERVVEAAEELLADAAEKIVLEVKKAA